MIRTLIAAASPVMRAGLEALLVRSTSVAIVATTPGESLADEIETHEPQVVLLAIEPGIDATPAIAWRTVLSPDAAARTPAFVLVADSPGAAWTADAIRAGARAVLPSDASPEEIVAAVEAAAVGLVTMPADVASELFAVSHASSTPRPSGESGPLTRREIEVLGMLAEGLANKNIAARLGISEHTVKTHVASILAKLDAFSRAEAVAIGARQGLILL